jgi:hypothetical protein
MYSIVRITVFVGLVCLAASPAAMPPVGSELPSNDDTRSWDNDTYINANRILMFVTNHCNFGRDLSGVFGYDAGTFFPFTTIADIESGVNTTYALYAAGLWLGGVVDGQIRVAIAEYSDEYVPGPMAGGTYQPDDPSFRVYKLYRDSLAANPNADYLNWPVGQGAPVNALGQPAMRGDQMTWSVCNDADPNQHQNDAGETDPLGVELHHTTWAYDDLGPAGNTIYIRYKLYNNGPNTIEDFYISMWTDPDLGHAGDDQVGCDTLDDLFFCYNGDNDDAGHYEDQPPCIGFKVLKGPLAPSPSDTADFDGAMIPGYKNLGMVSFKKYINGTDPNDFNEAYNYMQGLSASGGPYVYNGDTLLYMHSGDPVSGTGDLDTDPADRRGMGSFGPFDFNPGDSQYVLIKMAVGQGEDRLSSITEMRALMNFPEPQVPMLKALVEPHPVSMIMLNALEPVQAVVTFGYDADGPFGEYFEYGNLSVSGLPPIDSMRVVPEYPGFIGPVARFYFPLAELLTPYVPLFDSAEHPYSVSGTYANYEPFSFNTSVTIHGHRSGDLNLDGAVDISDLVFMVEYFFVGGPAPEDLSTADLDYNGSVDISDMLVLIEFMFGTE